MNEVNSSSISMSSDTSPDDDVDSKKIIALVGTDKLDGSELDNVKTGLTPPNKTSEYFDQQYSVENITTPMRFDEDDNQQSDLEIHPGMGFSSTQSQYMKFRSDLISSNFGKWEISLLF